MEWSADFVGFVTVFAGLAATYAKGQSDIARLKVEVKALQRKEAEVAKLLTDLTQTLHRVEKALVRAGLIEVE